MRIGFDIGGSGIRAASARDLEGAEIARWTWTHPNLDDILTRIECTAIERGATSVAIGIPGQVVGGVVVDAPNLPALDGIDLRQRATDLLGIDVVVENDASLAALGSSIEHDLRDLLLVTLGTGVGAGRVVGGQLVGGRAPGELGHVWSGGTVVCGCGAEGCLETWCGAAGLTHRAGALGLSGGPSSWGEDPRARGLWRDAGRALGRAVRSVVHLEGPEVVWLAGGLVSARRHWQPAFDEELATRLAVHADLDVRFSTDAASFALRGAVAIRTGS